MSSIKRTLAVVAVAGLALAPSPAFAASEKNDNQSPGQVCQANDSATGQDDQFVDGEGNTFATKGECARVVAQSNGNEPAEDEDAASA